MDYKLVQMKGIRGNWSSKYLCMYNHI